LAARTTFADYSNTPVRHYLLARGGVLRAFAGRHRAVRSACSRTTAGWQCIAGESHRGRVDRGARIDARARARAHVARAAPGANRHARPV